jgi:hypothetical protein
MSSLLSWHWVCLLLSFSHLWVPKEHINIYILSFRPKRTSKFSWVVEYLISFRVHAVTDFLLHNLPILQSFNSSSISNRIKRELILPPFQAQSQGTPQDISGPTTVLHSAYPLESSLSAVPSRSARPALPTLASTTIFPATPSTTTYRESYFLAVVVNNLSVGDVPRTDHSGCRSIVDTPWL